MDRKMLSNTLSGVRIAWLLPRIDPGAGGLQTIFRHVTHLQKLGAECHVLTCQLGIADNAASMRRIARESYQCEPDKLFDVANSGESYDLAIATLNTTVPYLFDLDAREFGYFVQDYEPLFYAAGDAYEKAKGTYRDNVHIITIGNWLVHELAEKHGVKAQHTDFTADVALYRPLGIERRKAVCAIFQPHKDRRCHELVVDTLQVVHAIAPDVSIIVYGSDSRYSFPFPVENRGLITKEECNQLYNECMVGLSISSTNPSRIPFEMMASGLPVVDLYQDNMLWDFEPESVVLAEPNCEALATAILSIINNPERAALASKAGLSFMSSRTAEKELDDFAVAVASILSGDYEGDSPKAMYTDSAVSAPEEVSEVARAVGYEKRVGAVTPPAIECSAQYVRIGISGLPEGVGITDVYFNAWRDDQRNPAFIRYNARGLDNGVFWAQINLADFGNIPGLYHCQAWCRQPDASADRCCAERSLRVGSDDPTVDAHNEGKWVSMREGCTLSLELSSKPYAFSAKSTIKQIMPESGIRVLKSIAAKVR